MSAEGSFVVSVSRSSLMKSLCDGDGDQNSGASTIRGVSRFGSGFGATWPLSASSRPWGTCSACAHVKPGGARAREKKPTIFQGKPCSRNILIQDLPRRSLGQERALSAKYWAWFDVTYLGKKHG